VETAVGRGLVVPSLWEGAVIGRVFVVGIFEGTRMGFTVFEANFGFNLEVDGSRNRSSSSSDEGTKKTWGKWT
jgi:hypothetical protein